MNVTTIEAVARAQFPGYRVRVAVPFDSDRVDIYVLARCKRGKRQYSQYYARCCIAGIVFRYTRIDISRVVSIELEHLREQMEEKMEMARLVGWRKY